MTSSLAEPRIRPLLSVEQIQHRVAELGAQISSDYGDRVPTLVCILKGSLPFFVDLARAITIPVRFDYLATASYMGTESTGVVRFVADLSDSVEGRDILLVEDIVDSGLTLAYLRSVLGDRRPASLEICALLVREGAEDSGARYAGFPIPPDFVVGYGLDVAEHYREQGLDVNIWSDDLAVSKDNQPVVPD